MGIDFSDGTIPHNHSNKTKKAHIDELGWFDILNYSFIKEITVSEMYNQILMRQQLLYLDHYTINSLTEGDGLLEWLAKITEGTPRLTNFDENHPSIQRQRPCKLLSMRNVLDIATNQEDLDEAYYGYVAINFKQYGNKEIISELNEKIDEWRRTLGVNPTLESAFESKNFLSVSSIGKIFKYYIIPLVDIHIWGRVNNKRVTMPQRVDLLKNSGYNSFELTLEQYKRTVSIFYNNIFASPQKLYNDMRDYENRQEKLHAAWEAARNGNIDDIFSDRYEKHESDIKNEKQSFMQRFGNTVHQSQYSSKLMSEIIKKANY